MTNPLHMTSFRMLEFIPQPIHTVHIEVLKHENKFVLLIFALLGCGAVNVCC
jgi:hypothetical protein